MKAKTLILPILFVAIGIATYWFYSQSIISANSTSTKSNQPEAAVSITTKESKKVRKQGSEPVQKEISSSQDIQNKASEESLHELKNSIQGVIADSIQEEIQEAVENKIIKTDGVQQ